MIFQRKYDRALKNVQEKNAGSPKALEDENLAGIPIIAMTANAFAEDRQNAMAAGMNEHVAKPIDVPKLIEVLQRIL